MMFVPMTVMLTAHVKVYGFPMSSGVDLVIPWDEFISKFRLLIPIGFLPRRKIDFLVGDCFISNQAEEMRDAV